jgi:hypothetical protein
MGISFIMLAIITVGMLITYGFLVPLKRILARNARLYKPKDPSNESVASPYRDPGPFPGLTKEMTDEWIRTCLP